MTLSARKPNRFRIALSFPRQHRPRVEKIAEVLAGRLGREFILCDKWRGVEFTLAALGVHRRRVREFGRVRAKRANP